jgi:hypothetical protein
MKDILLDDNEDIQIQSGDLVIGESGDQHVRHLVKSSKGEYKANPEIGVNLIDFLETDKIQELGYEINDQLKYDGATPGSIVLDSDTGEIFIKADY